MSKKPDRLCTVTGQPVVNGLQVLFPNTGRVAFVTEARVGAVQQGHPVTVGFVENGVLQQVPQAEALITAYRQARLVG